MSAALDGQILCPQEMITGVVAAWKQRVSSADGGQKPEAAPLRSNASTQPQQQQQQQQVALQPHGSRSLPRGQTPWLPLEVELVSKQVGAG